MDANTTAHSNRNTVLLQVLAHDLLAPLTAVRWQAELLARPDTTRDKRARYLAGITESAVLGIAITKHVHVAAHVLAGSYEPVPEAVDLGGVIQKAFTDMVPQYGRHGLTLDCALRDERVPYTADPELIGALVWSVGKFFLAVSPAGTSVRAEGGVVTKDGVAAAYVVTTRVPISAEERGRYERCFSVDAVVDEVSEQSALFGALSRSIAGALGVALSAHDSDACCVVETAFPLG